MSPMRVAASKERPNRRFREIQEMGRGMAVRDARKSRRARKLNQMTVAPALTVTPRSGSHPYNIPSAKQWNQPRGDIHGNVLGRLGGGACGWARSRLLFARAESPW